MPPMVIVRFRNPVSRAACPAAAGIARIAATARTTPARARMAAPSAPRRRGDGDERAVGLGARRVVEQPPVLHVRAAEQGVGGCEAADARGVVVRGDRAEP